MFVIDYAFLRAHRTVWWLKNWHRICKVSFSNSTSNVALQLKNCWHWKKKNSAGDIFMFILCLDASKQTNKSILNNWH